MKTVPLNRVFTISHGNKFDLNKMGKCATGPDAVAFVGRSAESNGLTSFVDTVIGVEPFSQGLITVALGGSALSSFVQPRPFYTGQNIDVLIPIDPDMSLDVKFFYCLCIEANRFRYSTFGREANRTLKTILVPSLESVPSWVTGSTDNAITDLCEALAEVTKAKPDAEIEVEDALSYER